MIDTTGKSDTTDRYKAADQVQVGAPQAATDTTTASGKLIRMSAVPGQTASARAVAPPSKQAGAPTRGM
jgi:hypothetical protein